MASETFKKRQKEMARKEKQQKKSARRMDRRNERAKTEGNPQEDSPNKAESVSGHGPTIL